MASAPAGTLYRGGEGMWSWVAHRITGVAVFFFLLVHVLDTALVRVAPDAYDMVSANVRQAMGLPAVTFSVGDVFDAVGIDAPSVRGAIADAPTPAEALFLARRRAQLDGGPR